MRRLREAALAFLLFCVASVLFTWPMAAQLSDGLADLWDAKLNAWIFHWDFHQTFHDPLHLFDANIFYPARYALAFSENLYGASLFGFPLLAAGVSTLTVYNVLFLLGMVLSGLAAWALARAVTGDTLAALVAGVVYAFVPWRLAQLPHVQFQWGAALALVLLFHLRYLDGGRRRDLFLFGLSFAWNAITNVHYTIFSGILLLLVLFFRWLAAADNSFRSRAVASLLAAGAAAILVLPFYIPYARATSLYGMRRAFSEIESFSARPVDFLTAGPQNKLYAPLTQRWAQAEGDLFPGLSVAALALFALKRLRGPRPGKVADVSASRRRAARLLDAAMLAGLALWAVSLRSPGLGPLKLHDSGRILVFVTLLGLARLLAAFPRRSRFADLRDFVRRLRIGATAGLFVLIAATGAVVALGTHTPYYRFLVQSCGPVFRAIRAPSRGVVLFDLALGVLAAWGLSLWTRSMPRWRRGAAVAGALLLIAFEYRASPIQITHVEQGAPPVYGWLGRVALSGAVVEWPFGTSSEVEYQFRSTAHWKPLVNGYSGFGPPRYQELVAMMTSNPIPGAIWRRLADSGAALLVFHPGQVDPDARRAYRDAVAAGIARGDLEPVASFPAPSSRDYVFRLASAPLFPLPAGTPDTSRAVEEARQGLQELERQINAPFGYIDRPRENAMVEAGFWAYGWALDDSGIARVEFAVDGGAPQPAVFGEPHPGIVEAYPGYPGADHAGFGFGIPKVRPGSHTLTVILHARDGGLAELKQPFEAR